MYDNKKQPFSDATSAVDVLQAMRTTDHSTRVHPGIVDAALAELFNRAAEIAHTIQSHDKRFWRVVMTRVPWTRATAITPVIVEELASYTIQGRLRWQKFGPARPLNELNTSAAAIEHFFTKLRETGMQAYIPTLETPDGDDPVSDDDLDKPLHALLPAACARLLQEEQVDARVPLGGDQPGVMAPAEAAEPQDEMEIDEPDAATPAQPTVAQAAQSAQPGVFGGPMAYRDNKRRAVSTAFTPTDTITPRYEQARLTLKSSTGRR